MERVHHGTETGYQMDIYDQHLPMAIDTLHEMMTDTIITPQKIESARDVIHRERAGTILGSSAGSIKMESLKTQRQRPELLLPGRA